jgi:cAMP-dependent protein kinase regulator
MDPRLRDMTPEEYLSEMKIRPFLTRIVRSLLLIRPQNIERHVVNLLSPAISQSPSVEPPDIRSLSASFTRVPSSSPATIPSRSKSDRVLSASVIRRPVVPPQTSQPAPKSVGTVDVLMSAIRQVDLFSFLQDDQRSMLINAMVKREYVRGDVVFRENSPPSDFFIIESGEFVVTNQGTESIHLAAGQYFGEQALIYGVSQRRSIVCVSDTAVCWAIDQRAYLSLLKSHHLEKRRKFESVLETVPILKPLQPPQISLVADALRAVDAVEGSEVVRQGEPGDEFYIVLEGECIVQKDGQEIGRIGPGKYFGELALIKHEPRAATIIAGAGCKLVKLTATSFTRLLGPCTELFEEGMKSYQ